MFIYAQLDGDIVTAITETSSEIVLPNMILLSNFDISLIGSKYNFEDGSFTKSEIPVLPKIITKIAMLTKRLTMEEFVNILSMSKTDPQIEAWKYIFDTTTVVDLDSQNTKDGVALLVSKGLLTQARADKILTDPVQPEERP